MATPRGLEPLTSGVTGRRSNQLNYEAILWLAVCPSCQASFRFVNCIIEIETYQIACVAASTGIEPAIFAVTGRRGLQLPYEAI